MMLKQHVLCALALFGSASIYANVPIESRGLSQNPVEPSANSVAINSGATTANVPTNLNWQIMQKNQQLENDIRALRGKIEEQDNEIEKLKHELTNRYTDLDQRLELLQQKIDPESTASEEDNQQGTSPSTENTPTTAPVVAAKTASTQPAAVTTQTSVTKTQTTSPADLDKAAYTVALDAYKQGGAKKAIAPMKNFIKNNPHSIYISNAYFWLAEFNLAIEPTNYAEAKKNYNIVINQYPNSAKASLALYQLHNIAKDVDRNTILANQLKTKLIKDYPKSEEASYFKK